MSENPNDIISLKEIIDEDARNMAGCDDSMACTYPKGYVKRQAIYSCVTCFSKTGNKAGLCYPCSVKCHSDHEVIDLYTKRSFRCDCGNTNFPEDAQCLLDKVKDTENEDNTYNDNFCNKFCVCETAEGEKQDEEDMWQCNVCEDWFHLKCLTLHPEESAPDEANLESALEFTCRLCLEKHPWLRVYNSLQSQLTLQQPELGFCRLAHFTEMAVKVALPSYGVLWTNAGWRDWLCECASCMQLGCWFLLRQDDTVAAYLTGYEAAQPQKQGLADQLGEAVKQMPHSQGIRIAEGVALFQKELSRLLQRCASSDQVVTEEMVTDFYDDLCCKKRRLDDNTQPPPF